MVQQQFIQRLLRGPQTKQIASQLLQMGLAGVQLHSGYQGPKLLSH